MYAGKIVEQGATDDVIDRPVHPYTMGLLGSVPTANKRGKRLYQISGMAPNMMALPQGCAFKERCPRRAAECETTPEITTSHGRAFRCHHPHVVEPA